MKTVEGNLLDMAMNGDFDVIVHGCNCFCNFGAGIALQILNRFPEAFEKDKQTKIGDKNKMGNFTHARIVRNGKLFRIVNAYTQYGANATEMQCDYDAMDKVFKIITIIFDGERIGYPKIGAGLAGGDWNVISKIIDEALIGQDHTLVILPQKNLHSNNK